MIIVMRPADRTRRNRKIDRIPPRKAGKRYLQSSEHFLVCCPQRFDSKHSLRASSGYTASMLLSLQIGEQQSTK